jgi:hypothetical protein
MCEMGQRFEDAISAGTTLGLYREPFQVNFNN